MRLISNPWGLINGQWRGRAANARNSEIERSRQRGTLYVYAVEATRVTDCTVRALHCEARTGEIAAREREDRENGTEDCRGMQRRKSMYNTRVCIFWWLFALQSHRKPVLPRDATRSRCLLFPNLENEPSPRTIVRSVATPVRYS